jgi:hypothetical protein
VDATCRANDYARIVFITERKTEQDAVEWALDATRLQTETHIREMRHQNEKRASWERWKQLMKTQDVRRVRPAAAFPNAAVFVNRTMEECARAFAKRRIRAVNDSGRVIDIWT